MKLSIIIPSFKRQNLLRWNLLSLSKQEIPFEFETIILNDGVHDQTEQLCSQYKEKLNIKYIFTGQRNLKGNDIWRVPGFAINIGVKHSTGDILLFCCAEMFHLNDSVKHMVNAYNVSKCDKILAIPQAKDDDGRFLRQIELVNGEDESAFSSRPGFIHNYMTQEPLINVKFPFFLAMKRQEFIDIGGYDEDFTGTDYDDSDLVDRLVLNGCTHVETDAKVIHLWHPRLVMSAERIPRFKHNEDLYYARKGVIVRNVDREWGVL